MKLDRLNKSRQLIFFELKQVVALSIAGSDSGAGAGIQADLKTFSALGVYGCTAITALTAQNTKTVAKIQEISSDVIEAQISSVTTDLAPSAIKIGMVYSKQTIDVVARSLKRMKVPIVLDPILAAGTGAKLQKDDALDMFISKLLPLATVITPNRMEAEILSGIKIGSKGEAISAAKRLKEYGAKNVIIKGGHFREKTVTDLLLLEDSTNNIEEIVNPRIDIEESHGSGCNFSAATTAYLARGVSLEEACEMANKYVHEAITNVVTVGKGLPVTSPLSAIYRDAMRYRVLSELQSSVDKLISLEGFYQMIPETQTNFAYALPFALDHSEVAAVRGRIVKAGTLPVQVSRIEFGASRHMASAILAYMSIKPTTRAVINICLNQRILAACKRLFSDRISSYDRSREPKDLKRREGSTISWGTKSALAKNPRAEIIYHQGDVGKEPMITVFGNNPAEVTNKIEQILKNC
jgi:hydroxymethylpyrimidine kinase/phosphomethylpyrimidine kinase